MLTSFARSEGYSYLRFLTSNLLATLASKPLDLSELDMYTEGGDDDETLDRLEVSDYTRQRVGRSSLHPTLASSRGLLEPDLRNVAPYPGVNTSTAMMQTMN